MKKSAKTSTKTNEMLFGAYPIIEMLKAGKRKLVSLYTTKPVPRSWSRLEKYLPKAVGNIQYVSKDILTKMAGTTDHMGVLAWVTPFKYRSKMFTPATHKFVLLLDSLQDVRNLGAVLRSAYCTGVTGVVLCQANAAPLTPAAFKASAGLAEYLDIYVAPSMGAAVVELKKAGYKLYMAVLDGQDATTVTVDGPTCLVIGNESTGIQASMRKEGTAITLPQRSPDISYNASVAAGILLFLLSQQMGKK